MLKNFMYKFNPTIENLEKELLGNDFDAESAETIINSHKVNINKIDENGNTLLHKAIMNNKFRASQWLIKNGINVRIENNNGLTPQRLAVEKGNLPLIDALIQHSHTDINQLDDNGRSLLQDAVLMGHIDVAKQLIQNSIDVNNVDKKNRNVSFDALDYGDNNIINEVLLNTEVDLNLTDIYGNTILHNKEVLNNDDLAVKLLKKGADPTIINKDGNNFLTIAALRGGLGEVILDTAIQCGCDLNSTVSNNNSVLMEVMFAFAKISKTEEKRRKDLRNVAKKLMDNGLDVKALNNDGESVLFNIVRNNDIEGCAFLLEHNKDIDINHKNREEETLLSISILQGVHHLDMILLLLEYGADPTITNRANKSVLEILNEIILHVHNIKRIRNRKILRYISSTGNYMFIIKEILSTQNFNFNFLDSTGNPLFFMPFINGDIPTTRLYFKYGLDINANNKNGNNIFYEYVSNIFESGLYDDNFRAYLSFLLINNVDIKTTNELGQNIFSKVALTKECNLKLFRNLVDTTKFDYRSTDNLGRTIVHSCVWSNNIKLLNLIHSISSDIQNIPDNYNMLPITYSALFGHKEMVKEFLKKDAIVRNSQPIPKFLKEKFQPLLKNLSKLTLDCNNKDELVKIEVLKSEVERSLAL